MLTFIVVIVILLALGGGGWGYGRYGWIGMSPAGLVLAVLAVLYLTGNLAFR